MTQCSSSLTPSRYPRVSGREGAPAVDDDQPAERSEGAATGSPLRAEEHGRPAAGEAAAADGAGSTTAGTGTAQRGPLAPHLNPRVCRHSYQNILTWCSFKKAFCVCIPCWKQYESYNTRKTRHLSEKQSEGLWMSDFVNVYYTVETNHFLI